MTTQDGEIAACPDDLAENPAVVAWMEINERRELPIAVQTLRRLNGRPNVLRLVGTGPGRSNVIAKGCQDLVESHVYKDLLPRLGISSPSYYGHTKDARGDAYWLFIEDAGEEKYSPITTEHQILVSKWLAELHTSASNLRRPHLLPDRSPDWFLAYLRSIRSTIELRRPIWAHLGDDATAFQKLTSQCDALESRWDEVRSACEGIPSTLVHCDFVPKNICVRSSHGRNILLPFDWEVAGWGNPATDIAHLIATPGAPRSKSTLVVDSRDGVEAYWKTVHERWSEWNLAFFERLALVGQIFRMLLAVNWALEDPLPSGDRIVSGAPLLEEQKATMYNRASQERSKNWMLSVLPLYESRLARMLSML
ncbi:MAG TPA: phosphotransferase [Vicinamibacteria bacterium]|nr:phosphotransferase [Vicinamibacteria bacterium]